MPVAPRLALVAVAAAAALAGCGGSGSDMGSSAPAAASQEDAAAPGGAGGGSGDSDGSGGGSGGSGSSGGAAAEKRTEVVAGVAQAAIRRVRTAQVTVEVNALETSAAVVRQIAVDLGGIIGSETTGFGAAAAQPAQPGSSSGVPAPTSVGPSTAVVGEAVIVLRVPEPKLDEALLRVSKVGKELTRTSSAEDVSATLADLDSRVATQQRSLERIRALLARASSLQEIVSIEAELARREADLEALQARRRSLDDQATFSTLTAILRLPDAKPSSLAPDGEDESGFVSGLKDGWHALVASTTVVLTVVGAMLPPVAALLVIGVPLWLLWRRFRPEPRPRPGRPVTRPLPAPAPPAPPPSTP
jgi:hypothetical protein